MPSEPGWSGSCARIARPASVQVGRAGRRPSRRRSPSRAAVGLLVVADPHHVDLALQAEQLAGHRERRSPLAGAGLGGERRDALLLVVVGLRDGGVGLVGADRRDALVLVVDVRRGVEPSPAAARAAAASGATACRCRGPAGDLDQRRSRSPGRSGHREQHRQESGVTGSCVPGCSGGGIGGMSALMLYQAVGIPLSPRSNRT